jgi:hypothetical protein
MYCLNNSALKDYFDGLAEIKSAGRLLSFSVFQLFCTLQLLSRRTTSRAKIAKQLSIGEGTTRTILGRLVNAGLVKTSKAGCKLTVEGLHVCYAIDTVFPKRGIFSWTELTPSNCNYSFVIRNGANKVGSGIEQRDKAIVAGATSALVVVFQNGLLRINSVSNDIENEFPVASRQILRDLKPQENDAIVIATGETFLKAMHGAFAASWSLLDSQVNV